MTPKQRTREIAGMENKMTTKKQLTDKIAELQAQVDAMPDDEWPQEGDGYWLVSAISGISHATYRKDEDWSCKWRLKQGNCFRTKEGAELKAKQNEVLASMRRIADSEGEYSPLNNLLEREFFVVEGGINCRGEVSFEVEFCYKASSIPLAAPVFRTKELAQKAIDELDLDCLLEVAR